ncbi:MAG: 30S ribosomal protein S16 [Candidatus Aminicenantes bacterium]|nr:30S ribosomal protein S16 [Candidatus Aminicenantes bacterium]
MMISMRLMRFGAKKKPFYRIVVIDSRRPRESKAIDYLGYYDPLKDPAEIKIDLARAKAWLARGVQASKTVLSLLDRAAQSGDATE